MAQWEIGGKKRVNELGDVVVVYSGATYCIPGVKLLGMALGVGCATTTTAYMWNEGTIDLWEKITIYKRRPLTRRLRVMMKSCIYIYIRRSNVYSIGKKKGTLSASPTRVPRTSIHHC